MTALETTPHAPRQRWLAVLARAARHQLELAHVQLHPAPAHDTVRQPESGMVMLRGRVSGTGDAFPFGEATVTRCAVRVGEWLGLGYTLGRDRRKAELMAVFDALLQDPARRDAVWSEVIEPLARDQAAAAEQEARAVAGSRVEFFTMVRGEAA